MQVWLFGGKQQADVDNEDAVSDTAAASVLFKDLWEYFTKL